MAELGGEPVGTVSAVAYGSSFGFGGLYLVRPELRSRGIGHRLWDAAIARLGTRTIGLDGVPAQEANYAQAGFRRAHANVRYRGEHLRTSNRPRNVDPISEILFEAVAAYDHGVFGASRETFLREWIAQPGGVGLAKFEDRRVTGYGLLRPCRDGLKIAPCSPMRRGRRATSSRPSSTTLRETPSTLTYLRSTGVGPRWSSGEV